MGESSVHHCTQHTDFGDCLWLDIIDAYARAIRRIGAYFDYRIDDLSEPRLTSYFTDLLDSHSWSAVKLDLYGLKFYYTHVLHRPWKHIDLIKPPKTRRLPDIVTLEEAKRVFMATHTLSYRVFYFTLYNVRRQALTKLCLKTSINQELDNQCSHAHHRHKKYLRQNH